MINKSSVINPLGKIGVFVHYLSSAPGKLNNPGNLLTAYEWNRHVDSFDVNKLASQLSLCHIDYFFITLSQCSGYFCAPNKTYDKLTGITPSKCSQRDLILDLYDVLSERDIKLCVYLASEGPVMDQEARVKLQIPRHWSDDDDFQYQDNDDPIYGRYRAPEFQLMWEEIIREWSLRWGEKISAWWIDGAYGRKFRFPEKEEPNMKTLTAALKSGNPHSLVSYNSGLEKKLLAYSRYCDFTSGEFVYSLPEISGPFINEYDKKIYSHVLTYMGDGWGGPVPRYPDKLVQVYSAYAISRGAAVTWDVGINSNGTITDCCFKQLSKIKEILKT